LQCFRFHLKLNERNQIRWKTETWFDSGLISKYLCECEHTTLQHFPQPQQQPQQQQEDTSQIKFQSTINNQQSHFISTNVCWVVVRFSKFDCERTSEISSCQTLLCKLLNCEHRDNKVLAVSFCQLKHRFQFSISPSISSVIVTIQYRSPHYPLQNPLDNPYILFDQRKLCNPSLTLRCFNNTMKKISHVQAHSFSNLKQVDELNMIKLIIYWFTVCQKTCQLGVWGGSRKECFSTNLNR
jgi:hypothetical protein